MEYWNDGVMLALWGISGVMLVSLGEWWIGWSNG